MNLAATRTVKELATEIPNATRTFENLALITAAEDRNH